MGGYQVIIVGGGLAGLTASLHLRHLGLEVLVFEKQGYPHHKVCGEYVSKEVVPYLASLGICLDSPPSPQIDTLLFSDLRGKSIYVKLPLGGIGISRFDFDALLYQKAREEGVHFIFGNVRELRYEQDRFCVIDDTGNQYRSPVAIGAYGKRSHLDKGLHRGFVNKRSAWLAVKAHYAHSGFPEQQVALHSFEGGYAGLSKVGTGAVNFCYLASYKSFKRAGDVAGFNERVVSANPHLASFLEEAEPLFKEPLSIAQISFERKSAVEDHLIMCGDSAGLIHPLCGNGMAMAIHSAKLAAEHIGRFLLQRDYGRNQMERDYRTCWQGAFQRRLWMGRRLQSLLLNPLAARVAMGTVARSPGLLQHMISRTHGKPLHL
jgi:flavin-dependent dehydrogenase